MRLLSFLAALACVASAWGQGYPSKPIRLVVGYPPGGSGEFTTRVIADELAKDLGATVIVENKAGAGGINCRRSIRFDAVWLSGD